MYTIDIIKVAFLISAINIAVLKSATVKIKEINCIYNDLLIKYILEWYICKI